ncbi:MAG: ABC transporter substrate-binding protein [Pseudomonadota bacterium]
MRNLVIFAAACLAFVWAAPLPGLQSAALADANRAGAEAVDEVVRYRIYLNQDRTVTKNAAVGIEMGLRAALDDLPAETLIRGKRVEMELVIKDHRTNVFRAKQHMMEFAQDPNALLFFADVHSPPLLRYRAFINSEEILTFVPWAAGAGVTRPKSNENWMFRLSVDDRKAGAVIADHAVRAAQCRDMHFFLVDNPWGQGNARSLRDGLARHGRRASSTSWISWLSSVEDLRPKVASLEAGPRDCILLVAGSPDSQALMAALMELPEHKRPQVISHWGLASASFAENVPFAEREAVSLRFVQTCHNLFDDRPVVRAALRRLAEHADGAEWATAEIPAAPAFVHAFDLGRILVAALNQATLTGDVRADRRALRAALVSLSQPVDGLIRRYVRPFEPYALDRPNAHEALSFDDHCMGYYDADNVIRVLPRPGARTLSP